MSAESKQIDLLFEKARHTEVHMSVEQVAKVISASAVAGGLAALFTGKLKIMSMFFLGAVSIATTAVIINATSTQPVENEGSQMDKKSTFFTSPEVEGPELTGSEELTFQVQPQEKKEDSKELTYKSEDIELINTKELTGMNQLNSFEPVQIPETDIKEMVWIQQDEGLKKTDYFNRIFLAMGADVEVKLKLAKECGYKVDDTEMEELLEIKVRKDAIEISVKNDRQKEYNKMAKNKRVHITVYMKDLKEIFNSGSGSVISKDAIPSKDLTIQSSGSGEVDLEKVTPEKWLINLSGSGKVHLGANGKSSGGEVNVAGSGEVEIPNLSTENVEVSISGSGDVVVNAEGHLKAAIAGSGDICNKGKGKVSLSTTGSGKIHECD